MKFSDIIDQANALLQQKERQTYRSLKLKFDTDDTRQALAHNCTLRRADREHYRFYPLKRISGWATVRSPKFALPVDDGEAVSGFHFFPA